MRLTAQQIHEKLVSEDRILQLEGRITFYLGDVSIIVKQRDVVGNIMQEWLQGWLEKRGVEFTPSENTQMPPDFYLNPDDLKKNLLEVKAFNRNAGPGFDIADFNVYQEEIISKPYMLDVDYLIFGYDMSDEGVVTIKEVWLKKVWEITRRMEEWPINLQIKDDVVHKIRPGIWYSDDRTDFSIFENLEDFISAMEETMFQNPKTHNNAGNWKSNFLRNYKSYKGVDLDIPRWNDIKGKYDLKSKRNKEKALEAIVKAEDKKTLLMERLTKLIQGLNEAKDSGNIKKVKKAETDIIKARESLQKAEEKLQKTIEESNKYA